MEDHVPRRRLGERFRDHENRHSRRMVRALDKWQPRDDFRRLRQRQGTPPGARVPAGAHNPEIASRVRHGADDLRSAFVRNIGNSEAKVKPAGIAHCRITAGDIRMNAVVRLNEGERRDDDAPNALDRVKRQEPMMAGDEAAHHISLPAGPESRTAALTRLRLDQAVNYLPALDQEPVHDGVYTVDLGSEIRKSVGGRIVHCCDAVSNNPPLLEHFRPQGNEALPVPGRVWRGLRREGAQWQYCPFKNPVLRIYVLALRFGLSGSKYGPRGGSGFSAKQQFALPERGIATAVSHW